MVWMLTEILVCSLSGYKAKVRPITGHKDPELGVDI